MGIKVLSLFDGISCGMVALERAGVEVDEYIAYEIEKNAILVSQSNFNNIIRFQDVFEGDFKSHSGIDILIGGSPCTHWSIAKGGNGRETTSDGLGFKLFMEYVRALNESKPRYFLYENNYGMSDDIKDEISKKLGVQPIMIDSADFSAQKRKRLYWTNISFDLNWGKSDILFSDIEVNSDDHTYKSFEKYSNSIRVSKDRLTVSWDTSGKGNYSQQNRARKANQKMNTLPSSGDDKNNIWVDTYLARKIHPIEAERLQNLPDNYTSILKSKSKRIETVGNGWTVDVIAHILKGLLK